MLRNLTSTKLFFSSKISLRPLLSFLIISFWVSTVFLSSHFFPRHRDLSRAVTSASLFVKMLLAAVRLISYKKDYIVNWMQHNQFLKMQIQIQKFIKQLEVPSWTVFSLVLFGVEVLLKLRRVLFRGVGILERVAVFLLLAHSYWQQMLLIRAKYSIAWLVLWNQTTRCVFRSQSKCFCAQ